MSSPAPDSRITTLISQSHAYSPCNVLGNKNATPLCDFGYFPDPENKTCYGLNLISLKEKIVIGNASQYCTGNSKLLNLNSNEEISNLEHLMQTGNTLLVTNFNDDNQYSYFLF